MTAAVHIEGVTKTFGKQKALDAVSFDIPAGSVFGLLGPNGAGKTTLFSIIANFLKADSGKVEVLGIDVANIGSLQGRLSILPQDALFQSNVPVREQLEFFGLLSGMSKQQAADETTRVLTMVQLMDAQKKNARALSHGMTKRLGIAQAFMGKPEVIVLDEPTVPRSGQRRGRAPLDQRHQDEGKRDAHHLVPQPGGDPGAVRRGGDPGSRQARRVQDHRRAH